MQIQNSKLKKPVNRPLPVIAGVILVLALAAPGVAYGQLDKIASGIGGFLSGSILAVFSPIFFFINALGFLLFSLVLAVFLAMIQMDITAFMGTGQAVDTVWRLLRDLSNMFFIIVFMAIAFGTMLKIETYKWQRMIPKLAAMAILINFSKTIALIILDFSNLLMMTFVNAFKDIAVDNIITGTRIIEPFKNISFGADGITGLLSTVMTSIMIFAVANILGVILILVMFRIVFLWMFIAISPVAYVTNILDSTQKYAQKWWSMYIKLVLFGPMLAFFLWFALMFMAGGSGVLPEGAIKDKGSYGDVTDSNNFANFLIGTILLIVGTGMAVSSSQYGGKVAGKVWEAGKKSALKKGSAFAGNLSQRGWRALPGAKTYEKAAQSLAGTKFGQKFGKSKAGKWIDRKGKGVGEFFEKNKLGRILGGVGKIGVNKLQLGIALTVPEARKAWLAQRDEKRRLESIMGAEAIAKAGAIDTYNLGNLWRMLQTNLSGADTDAQIARDGVVKKAQELATSPFELGKTAIQEENNALDEEMKEQNGIKDKAIYALIIALDKLGLKIDNKEDAEKILLSKDPQKDIESLFLSKNGVNPAASQLTNMTVAAGNLQVPFQNANAIVRANKTQKTTNDNMLVNSNDPIYRPDIIKKGREVAAQKAKDLTVLQSQLAGNFVFDTEEITRRQDQLQKFTKKELNLLRQIADATDDKKKKRLKKELDANHIDLRKLGYGSEMETQLGTLESASSIDDKLINNFAKFATVKLPQATKEQLLAAQLEGKSVEDLWTEYENLKGTISSTSSFAEKRIAQEKMKEKALLLESIAKAFDPDGTSFAVKLNSDGLIDSTTGDLTDEWDTRKTNNEKYFDRDNFTDPEQKTLYDERKQERLKKVKTDHKRYQDASDETADEGHYARLEAEKEAEEERLKKLEKKILGMRLESDYVRRQHEWHEVAEEEKKIMTDDSDELIQDYHIAVERGQTPRAKAIVQKLFKDGNGNDIIEANGWGANYKGMQNLGRQMMRDLHISEDEAMSFMKDMGDIARHVNQWAMAYSHITKNGKYVEASAEENFKKTLNMIRKAKPTLNASRFAFGYNDPAQAGKFLLHPAGLQYLLDDPRMIAFNLGRGMSAPNTLASIASNAEILKKFSRIGNSKIREMNDITVNQFFEDPDNFADREQESYKAFYPLRDVIAKFGR